MKTYSFDTQIKFKADLVIELLKGEKDLIVNDINKSTLNSEIICDILHLEV